MDRYLFRRAPCPAPTPAAGGVAWGRWRRGDGGGQDGFERRGGLRVEGRDARTLEGRLEGARRLRDRVWTEWLWESVANDIQS